MARIAPKLEVVRGVTTPVAYFPRVAGEAVTVESAAVLAICTPDGVALPGELPEVGAQQVDGSIRFNLVTAAGLLLEEDYSVQLKFVSGGVEYRDTIRFDLVLVPLSCPIDQQTLEDEEPLLPSWLAAAKIASAQPFIMAAWTEIVGRVRAVGKRPALLTDRAAFAEPCRALAMQRIMVPLIRSQGDQWSAKHALYGQQFETAWALLGTLKFVSDPEDKGAGARQALPRFRGP